MEPYGYNPTLLRIWRAVTKTFSLGTWLGVPVRMYWAAVVLMPLIFYSRLAGLGGGLSLLLTAVFFVGLFLIIWTHEMGHIACGWLYRIHTQQITLGPLGGVAHMNAPASSPREELWISLAGPAVHLVWLAVLLPIDWLIPPEQAYSWYGESIWYLKATNLWLLCFNLLPIYPLDGGRVLRALLSMRLHPNLATLWAANVGMIGGGLLVLVSFTRPDLQSSIGFIIGLTCIMRSLEEKRMARHMLVYQQSVRRDPWEQDPDAWKHGASDQGDGGQQPGWFSKRRRAKAERKAQEQAESERALNAQVDAVLERVSEVGMSGLTDEEKAVLKKASARHRDTN